MTKQISNAHEYADERTNVTGQMTPILGVSPDEGLALIIRGMVAAGSDRGIPIFADLQDSNGDPLPEDTEIALRYDAPGLDQPQVVSFIWDHIRPYRSLSINEQMDEDKYLDQTKHVLKNTDQALRKGEVPQVNVRDIDELQVAINSSVQIDWSNSKLYFDRNAVREV
ncbi:VP7/VP16-like Major capsid protein [Halanaeroarchaeum sp. HSR-CO]|uniref:hypothetical protein n=1 Tax=Halanaeroarchaeum sp. HSR-CO TaxID=2866382 RepID=UPI00217E5E61|nr:hypothetical protein [Halanaeroarchaeum sp. HSR-CO]UWG46580.1 VP7/VP16-like Major capsid protein [Halanaeroarchaeum sp. HSR-CO]